MPQFPGSLVDIAYHLPEQVVDNTYFRDTFPEWRVDQTAARTGVFARHLARADETAYDLALAATRKLLARHPGLADAIDGIIFCTQSPDYLMPSNAFLLQRDLGLKTTVLAFDYNLACSGYVYGLAMATGFIKTGLAKNLLLITADTYSKYLAEQDRATRMLFGDGATASWIGDGGALTPLIGRFDDFSLASDGTGWSQFMIKSGAARESAAHRDEPGYDDKIQMNGLQVLNFVNDRVLKQVRELLERNHLKTEQIEQFLMHQASGLALDSLRKRLRLTDGQMFSNLSLVGNTVSSSIPILIKDYCSRHEPAPGSRLLLCGFGVGYSWGSLLASK